ncbi:MAG: FkbM family methyltransferase, partial [Verrucomicrobiota bacterium]
MGTKRLLKSIAWKMLPWAGLELNTHSGLKLPVRDAGEWGCLGEVFVARAYEPFWKYLATVRGWVDLGCNAGFFSFALLDQLRLGQSPGNSSAFLGDANEHCVAQTLRSIQQNGLADCWHCRHVVVGPTGQTVNFAQFKFSVHSGIFSKQRGEKNFRYQTTDLTQLEDHFQGRYDLLKIDIEGAELFLFQDYGDWLKRFRYGLCEWHAPHFDGAALQSS